MTDRQVDFWVLPDPLNENLWSEVMQSDLHAG